MFSFNASVSELCLHSGCEEVPVRPMAFLVEGSDLSIVTRQGLVNIFKRACSDSINFKEILLCAHGNFKEQKRSCDLP